MQLFFDSLRQDFFEIDKIVEYVIKKQHDLFDAVNKKTRVHITLMKV